MQVDKQNSTHRGALLHDYRFDKCGMLHTIMSWNFPRLSQRFLMHLKFKVRCIALAFIIYAVFCFLVSRTPDARHIKAMELLGEQDNDANANTQKKSDQEIADGLMKYEIFAVEQANSRQPNVGFVISNPLKCNNEAKKADQKQILVLVLSKLRNFENRKAIRSTWGSYVTLRDFKVTIMFLLAVDTHEETDADLMNKLQLENLLKYDLIVGKFKDSYRNMTKKTMMGLQWFVSYCSTADVVLKTDDDVFIVFENLYKVLNKLQPVTLFGYCTANRTFVNRDPRSNAYVSYFDWNEPTVPRYCFGLAYGMDNYLAKMVYKTGKTLPYFPIEDIFVGVAIEASKVRVKFDYWNQNYTLHADQMAFGLSYCNRRFSIAFHQLNPMELHMVHNQFNAGKNFPKFCDGNPENYKLRNFQG